MLFQNFGYKCSYFYKNDNLKFKIMRKIKVLKFENPSNLESNRFCCACKAICLFTSGCSSDDALQRVKNIFQGYLENRLYPQHLLKMGWQVSENSVIPPTFTDEELIEFASSYFRVKITDYQIIELNVSVNGIED